MTDLVASVGSPSSNYEMVLDLTLEARNHPLVGALVAVENPMGEGSELALGTVTEITTVNKWHEDPAFRGVLSEQGEIPGMSGDQGDTRQARIRVQAGWHRASVDEAWTPSGPSLRMSPATGTPARVLTGDLVRDLTGASTDLAYMGHLIGTDSIPLPLNLPDFAGAAGAWHGAVLGVSGAGKSSSVSYLLATQMRHEDFGIVIVDPQGQWASEQDLPFSLQGFATELGRDVMVRRISEDLRLSKDVPLFINLLQHTKLMVELSLKHSDTIDIVWYEMSKFLRNRSTWTEDDPETLLRDLMGFLAQDDTAGRVYNTPDNQARFQQKVRDLLASPVSFAAALNQFAPIHNLFQDLNTAGAPRHSLTSALHAVFDRQPGTPAPVLILDMSTASLPGLDDEVDERHERALEILDSDEVKASILRSLFASLKRASESRFREGRNLNTMVVLDEAWRYAAPPGSSTSDELTVLSRDLAGYARDTRKFGIGWLYITQSTRSLNQDIWAQLTVRVFGYGLNGGDLDKMAEVVDDRSVLRLYRTFANPRQSGRYPFMLTGPVSPLAANATPVSVYVYTDFDEFRTENHAWIAPVRARLGEPVLTGAPRTAAREARPPATRRRQGRSLRDDLVASGQAARENRRAVGLLNPEGFSDPLGGLDSDPAPF